MGHGGWQMEDGTWQMQLLAPIACLPSPSFHAPRRPLDFY